MDYVFSWEVRISDRQKGQLILKRLFEAFNSLKKWTKQFNLRYLKFESSAFALFCFEISTLLKLEISTLLISCSRHRKTKFTNSESPIFTTIFLKLPALKYWKGSSKTARILYTIRSGSLTTAPCALIDISSIRLLWRLFVLKFQPF